MMAHGYNHQSYYPQPVSNVANMNGTMWNQNNGYQQMTMPHTFSTYPNQQFATNHANLQGQAYLPGAGGLDRNHSHGIPGTANFNTPSQRQSRPTMMRDRGNENGVLHRQTSVGAVSAHESIASQHLAPLTNSHSAGALADSIQRERRSHTMGPSARIMGPNYNMQANTFANGTAPDAVQAASQRAYNSHPQSAVQMQNAVADYDDEDDEEDDDAPIVIKVRYDPNEDGPPSEEMVRQYINTQLREQLTQKSNKDPIVLNFLDNTIEQEYPLTQMGSQPYLNQAAVPVAQPINHPPVRMPVSSQQQQQQLMQQQAIKQQQQLYAQRMQQQRQLQWQQQQKEQQERVQREKLLQQQKLQLQQKEQQRRIQYDRLLQEQRQKQELQRYQQQEQQRLQHEKKLQEQKEQQQRLQHQKLLQEQKQQQELQKYLQQLKIQEQQEQQKLRQQQKEQQERLQYERVLQEQKQQQERLQHERVLQEQKQQQELQQYLQQAEIQRQQEQQRLQQQQKEQEERLQYERVLQEQKQQQELQQYVQQQKDQQRWQLQQKEQQELQQYLQQQEQQKLQQQQKEQEERIQYEKLLQAHKEQELQQNLQLQQQESELQQKKEQERLQHERVLQEQQQYLQQQHEQQYLQQQEQQHFQPQQNVQQEILQYDKIQPEQHGTFQHEQLTQAQKEERELQQYVQQQQQLFLKKQKQHLDQQVQNLDRIQQEHRQRLQAEKEKQRLQKEQQQTYQYDAGLPPMGPRPSRTVPVVRPVPVHQPPSIFLQNSHMHPVNTFPVAPVQYTNPQQQWSNQYLNQVSSNNHAPTGLEAYDNYNRQYTPNGFTPIQSEVNGVQQSVSGTNLNTHNVAPNSSERPNTAPLATERYRPPSAVSIPELSKENLHNMLNNIPSIRGRSISIEYAAPTQPDGFLIPSQSAHEIGKYPEPLVVDRLPKNIIQHVRSSDNLELQSALHLPTHQRKSVHNSKHSRPSYHTTRHRPREQNVSSKYYQ